MLQNTKEAELNVHPIGLISLSESTSKHFLFQYCLKHYSHSVKLDILKVKISL